LGDSSGRFLVAPFNAYFWSSYTLYTVLQC
jgi:hypothetical protein